MKFSFKIGEVSYTIDQRIYHDISIPLAFDGSQPSAFGVEAATGGAYRSGGFIGDVSSGGSCNFEKISMVPHCNGTHTECLGHITEVKHSIREELKDVLVPATLISVRPELAADEVESYRPVLDPGDRVISRRSLEKAMEQVMQGLKEELMEEAQPEFKKALVIRTLPNGEEKLSRNYAEEPAPFFTVEAMNYLLEMGVEHLLVDLPSIDRSNDEGQLTNHHLFWEMNEGSHETNENTKKTRTITEFIYVKDEIKDGTYLLNLQIAPFQSDAASSRPVLFELKRDSQC